MTLEEAKELGRQAVLKGIAAFKAEEYSDWEEACAAWEETEEVQAAFAVLPDAEKSALWNGFERGWNQADAEEGLTEDERAWFPKYVERLGLPPDRLHFNGDVWRGRVQQVTIILEQEEHFLPDLPAWGNRAGESLGFRDLFRMELRKFEGSDRPDGWCAYLYEHSCILQGDPEPKKSKVCRAPEAAVAEIVLKLRKVAKKRNTQAYFIETGLSLDGLALAAGGPGFGESNG